MSIRYVTVTIDGAEFSSFTVRNGRAYPNGFRIDFDVTKGLSGSPDKARLVIYNAPIEFAKKALFSKQRSRCTLAAGYVYPPPLIAVGDSVKDGVTYERSGPDRVFEVNFSDGLRKYQLARTAISFTGKTTKRQVLEAVAAQAGLDIGKIDAPGLDDEYPRGYAAYGTFRESMDKIAAAAGADWTIQDEKIVMLGRGRGFQPTRGLVFSYAEGTLYQGPSPRKGGSISIRGRFNAELRPGAVFYVDSAPDLGSGLYKAKSVKLSGSSYTGDFGCEIEGIPYKL